MPVDQIKALVKDDFDAVNQLIISKIQSQVGLIDDLSHHIIESGGKRLRPLLVLLSSHACGYEGEDHIPLAAMIEFFHTATLLHDDVVDESTLRRGRQTANSIWGSKASILVGDYLFTQSVQLLVKVGSTDVLELISDTSHQVSCGEVKQLANRHNPSVTLEDYLDVIKSKTALLFAAASCIGAMLVKGDQAMVDNLYAYGLHLGNAFQLIDDALDYCSDVEVLGKNIGDDLADGKATLPLLHALEKGNPEQQKLITESLRKGSLEHLAEIHQAIKDTGAIEYTRKYAQTEVDKAITALNILPDSEYKQAMIDLAHFAISRKH